MYIRSIQRLLKKMIGLPIHPQWFSKKSHALLLELSKIKESKTVLDIGCFDKWAKKYIPESCEYYGLDYYQTATSWYFSKPDVFADAHTLPFADNTIDYVLIIDVLEHLECPNSVLQEIKRVLKVGGRAIVQVPFMYPIHDAPRDFSRYTAFGWRHVSEAIGFKHCSIQPRGKASETAALIKNISIMKLLLTWLKQKNPLVVFAVLAPILVLWNNLLGYLLGLASQRTEDFMPHSYLIVLDA